MNKHLLMAGVSLATFLAPSVRSAPCDITPTDKKRIEEAIRKGSDFLLDYYSRHSPADLDHLVEEKNAVLLKLRSKSLGRNDRTALEKELGRIRNVDDEFATRAVHLAVYALVTAGVPRNNDTVRKLTDLSLARLDKGEERTYDLALTILALTARPLAQEKDARYTDMERRKQVKPKIAKAVRRLVDNQLDSGCWTYENEKMTRKALSGGDLSNAQFAVLGLGAAHEAGIQVPQQTWKRIWEGFHDWFQPYQRSDNPKENVKQFKKGKRPLPDGPGGWPYLPSNDDKITGTMTCAGICSMVLAKSALDEKHLSTVDIDKIDLVSPALSLIEKYDLPDFFSPFPSHTLTSILASRDPFYHLYSLERVGALTRLEKIGEWDWYAHGAAKLLPMQNPDGSWNSSNGQVVGTSFALLFLARATEATFDIGLRYTVGESDE